MSQPAERQYRVLVVDDEATILGVVDRALRLSALT
jgi:hypothetical protein